MLGNLCIAIIFSGISTLLMIFTLPIILSKIEVSSLESMIFLIITLLSVFFYLCRLDKNMAVKAEKNVREEAEQKKFNLEEDGF